jgi:WD40 repeat protein
MRLLRGHTRAVLCLACSPDGRLLVSAGQDDAVRLWQLSSGAELRAAHTAANWRTLAISPDGRQLAAGSWEQSVLLCSVEQFTLINSLEDLSAEVWSLAYAPDGHALALGQGDGIVRIQRFQPSARPLLLRGHRWPVTGLAFTRDVRTLISASHDGTLRIWDAHWGQERLVHECGVWLHSLALAPGDGTLAVGTEDGRILLWSPPEERQHAELAGHRGPVSRLAFTPDGHWLLSSGEDGLVQLWDAAGTPRATYDWQIGPLFALAIAPDGMTALVGGAQGPIVVFDLDAPG